MSMASPWRKGRERKGKRGGMEDTRVKGVSEGQRVTGRQGTAGQQRSCRFCRPTHRVQHGADQCASSVLVHKDAKLDGHALRAIAAEGNVAFFVFPCAIKFQLLAVVLEPGRRGAGVGGATRDKGPAGWLGGEGAPATRLARTPSGSLSPGAPTENRAAA